jgi:DNA gyrase/topoisomerase IV subunit A
MRYPFSSKSSFPKVSTMPRQKTEAAALLDLYKLVTEQKRLQDELQNLEHRQQQIQQRLTVLKSQTGTIEQSIQQFRDQTPKTFTPSVLPVSLGNVARAKLAHNPAGFSPDTFEIQFLDY